MQLLVQLVLVLKEFHHRNLQRHRAFRESLQPYREDRVGSKAWRDELRPSLLIQSFQ